MLVFAIILMVIGAFLLGGWILILIIDIAINQQFPGAQMAPEAVIIFYTILIVAIVLIVVSIILFVLRAKRS
jgi:hypothetical protein